MSNLLQCGRGGKSNLCAHESAFRRAHGLRGGVGFCRSRHSRGLTEAWGYGCFARLDKGRPVVQAPDRRAAYLLVPFKVLRTLVRHRCDANHRLAKHTWMCFTHHAYVWLCQWHESSKPCGLRALIQCRRLACCIASLSTSPPKKEPNMPAAARISQCYPVSNTQEASSSAINHAQTNISIFWRPFKAVLQLCL